MMSANQNADRWCGVYCDQNLDSAGTTEELNLVTEPHIRSVLLGAEHRNNACTYVGVQAMLPGCTDIPRLSDSNPVAGSRSTKTWRQ